MKNQIFSKQAKPILFALHCHYTGDTQFRVWFDLDNSLTRWKRFFLKFSKIRNSRNSQNSVWKPIFFLGKLYQQLFGFTLSLHWWYSIPSLVWFGQFLDPMKKNFFKFLKNSQFAKFANFRMKTHFFSKTSYTNKFFALHSHYTGDTPCCVWFDLDNSLTRWKRFIFKILKNSQFAKFAKFRMKTHFFPRQAIPTTFWLYAVITLVILNTEFGLIWTIPWPNEEELF